MNGKENMAKKIQSCSDTDYNFSEPNKKTRLTNNAEEEYDIVFSFTIHHAEDIDCPTGFPINVSDRKYSVICWVEPGKENNTHIVRGLPNPVWKQSFRLILDPSTVNCRFLNLEVVRVHSRADPGTSKGIIVVGRVRIPLPSRLTNKAGRFGLVRLVDMEKKAEGHIVVSMEFKKICYS